MLKFTQAQKSLMAIKNMLPRIVTGGVVIQGEPTIYTDPENIPTVMKFMKNHTMTRCKQLIDITAVDVPTRPKRFEVPEQPPASVAPPSAPLLLLERRYPRPPWSGCPEALAPTRSCHHLLGAPSCADAPARVSRCHRPARAAGACPVRGA